MKEIIEKLAELAETHLQSHSDFYMAIDSIKLAIENRRLFERSKQLLKQL